MSGVTTAVITEVGVDYITATSHQRDSASPFRSFAKWLVSQEVQAGCKDSDWRASGYRGRHAGSVAFGVSQQGSIVRASSDCAREHWQQLLCLADNVTRLDLQVTVRPVAGSTATLSRHHKELLKAPRSRGKPAGFKMWYGPSGPEAATVGKRISDRYGRIYDKWLESQLEEYLGCLRYELELHRHVALATAQHLDSQEFDQDAILHQVSTFFRGRGLRIGFDCQVPRDMTDGERLNHSRSLIRSSGRSIPEVTSALRWIHNSVAPSVRRLIESGHREQVLRALGLTEVPATLAGASSSTWSNFAKER